MMCIAALILLTATAQIERFDAPAGPYAKVTHRFSNSLRYGDLVFISGQVAFSGKDHAELPEGIEAQTNATLANVDLALEAAGSNVEHVLQVTIWLRDIVRDYAGFNKVYDRWVTPGKPPARACIESKILKDEMLVEVMVVAAARKRNLWDKFKAFLLRIGPMPTYAR